MKMNASNRFELFPNFHLYPNLKMITMMKIRGRILRGECVVVWLCEDCLRSWGGAEKKRKLVLGCVCFQIWNWRKEFGAVGVSGDCAEAWRRGIVSFGCLWFPWGFVFVAALAGGGLGLLSVIDFIGFHMLVDWSWGWSVIGGRGEAAINECSVVVGGKRVGRAFVSGLSCEIYSREWNGNGVWTFDLGLPSLPCLYRFLPLLPRRSPIFRFLRNSS